MKSKRISWTACCAAAGIWGLICVLGMTTWPGVSTAEAQSASTLIPIDLEILARGAGPPRYLVLWSDGTIEGRDRDGVVWPDAKKTP